MQTQTQTLDGLLCLLEEARAEAVTATHARNTVRGYAYDWRRFEKWCQALELTALPAESQTVELYILTRLDGHKTPSVAREVAAIAAKHRAAGLPCPTLAETRKLIDTVRRKRMERRRQMAPISVENVRAIAAMLAAKNTWRAIRNRALILIGFTSALRGANLSEIRTDDLEFRPEGVIIYVRREKQDQAARGRIIGIPNGKHAETCPVPALKAWLDVRGNQPGRVFGLCPNEIRLIVKSYARIIGLDETQYGAHSLRAGFVTAAGESGAGELLIAAQTGHRSMEVLREYFRRSEVFRAECLPGARPLTYMSSIRPYH